MFLGELPWTVRSDRFPVFAADLMLTPRGLRSLFVPTDNAAEAGWIPETEVYALDNLVQVAEVLQGIREAIPVPEKIFTPDTQLAYPDFPRSEDRNMLNEHWRSPPPVATMSTW